MQTTLGQLQTDVSVTSLAEQVISLAELKKHLRVTHSLEDSLIEAARLSAISYVENYCGVLLGSYSATGYLPNWLGATFKLGPVTSVGAVVYDDSSGVEQTLPATKVYTNTARQPARIVFKDTFGLEPYNLTPVRVSYVVGYAPADIPAPIIAAIKLIVGHLYDMRTDEVTGTITTRVKLGTDALLSNFRQIDVL